MLLGVLHALAATDVHCENLIASGEHPVAVDLELLLNEVSPEPSVLATGLLPSWQPAPDGRRFDTSALGSDGAPDHSLRVPAWTSINTDQMCLSEDAGSPSPALNRVRLAERLPPVSDHLPAFLDGFREMYACLLTNRQKLLADEQMLQAFDGLELRVLVRNTATYTRIHLHLLHPEFLTDGLDRSIELEWLARPLSGTKTPQQGRARLYEHEWRAMENLDVPHFNTRAWKALEHSPDDLDMLPLCRERDSRVLRRRLGNLSPADCARQLAIIEAAVRSRFASVALERSAG